MAENVIIMGAAGRDFHNFNVYFKGNARYRVAAFTAAQIPDIAGRLYPPELAGADYPEGIPIYPESDLAGLIRKHAVDLVVFSYSDVPHEEVMHKASISMAEGADFILMGATYTMLRSFKPVIAVCAVRTGCGKSPTTRRVCEVMRAQGKQVVVVRHPMPYGDLKTQVIQRFSDYRDFEVHRCTIEEREEYEPGESRHRGVRGRGLRKNTRSRRSRGGCDRLGQGQQRHSVFIPMCILFCSIRTGPGMNAGIIRGNQHADGRYRRDQQGGHGPAAKVEMVKRNIETFAPRADIVLAESSVLVSQPELIRGKRVLVVEDGPTLTHGEMAFGAGAIAADLYGAAQLVDPRPYAVGSIQETLRNYPHIDTVLPATSYSRRQIEDLENTINAADCDLVLLQHPFSSPASCL